MILNKRILQVSFSLGLLTSTLFVGAQIRVIDNKGTISVVEESKWTRIGTTNDIYNKYPGNVGIGTSTPFATLHNAGSTLFGTLPLGDFTANGDIGTAAVDAYTSINISQNTAGITLTLPDPTNKIAGRILKVSNTGLSPVTVAATLIGTAQTAEFVYNGSVWTNPTAGAASTVPFSGLTNALALATVDNTTFAQTWGWTTATTHNPLTLNANLLTSGTLMGLNANALTSGTGLAITGAGTALTGNLFRVQTASTAAFANGGARFNFTGNHTGSGFQIDDVTTAGTAQTINATGTYTGTGLWNLNANSATTGTVANINANALTSGTGLAVTGTGTALTGNLFRVQTASTAAFANGGTRFNFTGNHTGSGFQIDDVTTAGTAQTINANALTSGTGLAVTGAGTALTGNLFRVQTASTAAFANGGARFNFTGNHTGSGFQIDDITTAGTAQTINATGIYTGTGLWNLNANSATTGTVANINANALTSGTGLAVTGTGTTVTGNLFRVQTASTAAFTNGGVRFNFTGAHTGNGLQINDATTTGTTQNIITSALTSGSALSVSGASAITGALGDFVNTGASNSTNGLLRVYNNNPSTTGIVFRAQSNSTADTGLTVLANGNTGLGIVAPVATLHNAGSTLFGTLTLGNFTANNPIGAATATVDAYTSINIPQTTAGITLTLPTPSNTTPGRILQVSNTGISPVTVGTALIGTAQSAEFVYNGTVWTSPTGGTVTSVSTAAANNGVTATWANNTSTPALTIGLGAITPTSVAATGAVSGSSLSTTGSITSTVATGTAPLVVSSTTPVDNLSIGGNAASATNATNTAITDDATTVTSVYPVWVSANSGNLPSKVSSTTLSLVPSSGVLTAGGFVKSDGTAAQFLKANGTVDASTYLTANQSISFAPTGDVTGTTTGTTSLAPVLTIGANAVTLAKMQEISTNSLLGRYSASTGNPEVIKVGSGLSLTGNTLTASGSGGTVTSVTTASANNGVTASWGASNTTTPALTIGLGDITPTSVAATGAVSGSSLSTTGSITSTVATGTAPLIVTSTTAVANLSIGGNAATATTATNTAITDDATTTSSVYPVWVSANSGNLPSKVSSTTLSLVPSSGVLTAGGFVKSGGTAAQFLKANGTVDASTYLTANQSISFAPTGDVTGTTTGTTSLAPALTIGANAVTFAKMQQIATNSLLGRSTAAAGNPEVITVGSGLTLSAGTLTASGSGGTVTSVTTASASNGVTASWGASNTTTPALTIGLGAITPSSVAATTTVSGTQLTSTVATGTAPLIVTSTTAVANLSIGGNAATATTATNTAITDDATTTSSVYPVWVSANSGNLPSKVSSTTLSLVPSSGVLTAGGFIKSGGTAAQFLKANGTVDASTYLTANQSISFAPSGDVTGSASGATSLAPALTIGANAVTLAKMQQIATNSLLGRYSALTGNTQVIAVGSGLTLSAGTLTASGSGGTVTSVTTASANNGVTATWGVSNTTTPALTIGLGDITPTSVAATGAVSGGLGTFSAGLTSIGGAINLNATTTYATNIGNGTNNLTLLGTTDINQTGSANTRIGNTTGTLTLEGGTAATAIQIGNGATAHGIQIGTGAAVNTLVLGSTNSTSKTTIQGGSGADAIAIDPAAGGSIVIGDAAGTGAITLGNSSAAQTVNIGTGAGASVVNIGSTAANSIVKVKSPLLRTIGVAIVVTATGTLSAANIAKGSVFNYTGGSNGTLTLDTGTNLSAALPGVAVGDMISFVVSNGTTNRTISIVGGVGTTLGVTGITIALRQSRTFYAINTGTNTWVIY